jgi:hypothetical protein
VKCQVRACIDLATKVRDIATIGESLCFCAGCADEEIKRYNEDFGWYELTPEREAEEVSAEVQTKEIVKQITRNLKLRK